MKILQRKIIGTIAVLMGAWIVVGCGGSGSSSNVEPKQLTIITDAKKIAYREKGGTWIESTGKPGAFYKTHETDIIGKYEVALKCKSGNSIPINLFALDTRVDDTLMIRCEDHSTPPMPQQVNFHLSQSLSGASLTSYQLIVDEEDGFKSGNSVDIALSLSKGKKTDIIALGNVGNTPKRFYLKRDYTPNNTHKSIQLTDTNSVEIQSKKFTVSPQTSAHLSLWTKNKTSSDVVHAGKWYYPDGLLGSEDSYFLMANDSANRSERYKTTDALSVPKKEMTIDLSNINKISGITYDGADHQIKNIHYHSTSAPHRGYVIELNKGGNPSLVAVLSNEYLEGKTVFEIEDLSSIIDWGETIWNAQDPSNVAIFAVCASGGFSSLIIRTWDDLAYMKNNYTYEISSQLLK